MSIDHGYTVLGLVEVAELLGVDKRTPHAWFYRGLLPEPEHESVNGGRAWDRPTIVRWAAVTGRLPVELAQEGVDLTDEPLPIERGGRAAKARIQEEKRSDS
jgi:hypothetical protein